MRAWIGDDLLSCVKICQTNLESPGDDFFNREYEKAKLIAEQAGKLVITVPDLFIRVRGSDKETEMHYTGFLVHSIIFGAVCPTLQSIFAEDKKFYLAQMFSEPGPCAWTANDFSKLVKFVYKGELYFEESEKGVM